MSELESRDAQDPWLRMPPAPRQIFCNRTLNLRGLGAIGFDMDYTLVHYKVEEWERRAYQHVQRRLVAQGFPVDDLEFDPRFVILGLIIDTEHGNIVKANRFGYIKAACHGTRMMSYDALRETYSRVVVDLAEPRWVFLNTLFGLSEACLYGQLVDRLDANALHGPFGYGDLYRIVRSCIDETHMEGELKSEIIKDPDRFVELDEELPRTLLDLKDAGKKLLLITNSEWSYTHPMMAYAFDRFLPKGKTWKSLFDLVFVAARKPSFFSQSNPAFEVVDDGGLLRPFHGPLKDHGIYLGGHAGLIEQHLRIPGEDILYVGDHIFADVNVSKSMLRWRTALVVRELEHEIEALEGFHAQQEELAAMMQEKVVMEHAFSRMRLAIQRKHGKYAGDPMPDSSIETLRGRTRSLREQLVALDHRIGPLARASGELSNERWGLLMRAGNDKSHLARQIERHADIYMSRVSNLQHVTPFVYLRSPRGSLPHDDVPGTTFL